MVEITHRTVQRTERFGDQVLTIGGRETQLAFLWKSGGWSWSYRRPHSVWLNDNSGDAVRLRDHVMSVRVAIVLAFILTVVTKRS